MSDTSKEVVERLAASYDADAASHPIQHGIGARRARDTAATLRALLAERDALREALRGLIAHLGPDGYIPGAGKPATDKARAALASEPRA